MLPRRSLSRRLAGVSCAAMALAMVALTGCCQSREVNATSDDLSRFGHHAVREQQDARADLDRFITYNAMQAEYLPLDAGRFIEWRKREW